MVKNFNLTVFLRKRIATLVIFGLIFPVWEALASPMAASETNQQSTAKESLPVEECQISDAAREAIDDATTAARDSSASVEAFDLIDQAEVAAKSPECDSVRAKTLAEKAKQQAKIKPRKAKGSNWDWDAFWKSDALWTWIAMLIHL